MTDALTGEKKKKSLWLVWSDGFGVRFFCSFVVMAAACAIGWQFYAVQLMLMEIQSWICEYILLALTSYVCGGSLCFCTALQLMTGAHKMAWWSVIGLLSSSCCAIQIVLNAMSLGCAGFNSILGPIRPTLLAFSLLIQCIVWAIARTRPWQLLPCVIGASGSLLLTFLPELLYLYNVRRNTAAQGDDFPAAGKSSTVEVGLQLQAGAMGCISCVQTVQSVIEKQDHTHEVSVSLEVSVATWTLS